MEKIVRDMMGGGLRPSDPRRFLIESMVAAMNADGSVDQRELDVLHRQLADHDLFAGLSQSAAKMLIDVATDAVKFAGNASSRVNAIAKGLPARVHRLAAYAMACQICAADSDVSQPEMTYLEALRAATRVSTVDAGQIFASARDGKGMAALDDKVLRLRSLVPVAAELFALRAVSRSCHDDDHRHELKDFFLAIPDLSLRPDELESLLFQTFRKPRAPHANVYTELVEVARVLPDPLDRYWMAVYVLVAEPGSQRPNWRVLPFAGLLQQVFQLPDESMDMAVVDAATFPATLPRPKR
jgi:uncharacterized tellurite resistance protein B-like protein